MKKDGFGSKFGVLMALAGSAVGLGNLWRFPYMVGTNGGAAFIILYLGCIIFLALPIMYAEFIVGRRSGANVFGAYKILAPNTKWCNVGYICLLCCIAIISFYSVVGGWTIDYLWKAISFQVTTADEAALGGMFSESVSNTGRSLTTMLIFLAITAFIVAAGIKDGIEKYSKIMMPLLFILVILLAIRSVTLPNAEGGLSFLLKPDFSKVTAKTFLDALGQAFFSLSVGAGTVITYASYVRKSENMVSISFQTAIADTLFALIAGLAIMPAVFAFGIAPGEGPGLVFITLPYIFAQLPFGSVLAILFFFILFIAAITSSISMLEVIVAYLHQEFKWSRKLSITVSMCIIVSLGTLCALSQGVLADVKVFDCNFFDLFDKTSSNILLPLGGLAAVIFAGWVLKKNAVIDEITCGGVRKFHRIFLNILFFFIKYIAPLVVLVIMIRGLF